MSEEELPHYIFKSPKQKQKENSMKKKTAAASIAMMASILSSGFVVAQVRIGPGGTDLVTLNNTSSPVLQLFVLDSITPAQTALHLASFEMEIGSDEGRQILNALLTSGVPEELVIKTQNSERTYRSVTLKEIQFPELNARAADAVRVKISLQSPQVTIRNASGGPGFASNRTYKASATRNNFRLAMGGLPAARVSRISAFNWATAQNEPVWFSIDIGNEQDLLAWRDWFYAALNKGNAENRRKEEGTISLLDRNLANNLLQLQLSQVEIVSLSSPPPNRDGLPVTTIGLRAATVSIGK